MSALSLLHSLSIPDDVYVVRARPGRAEVLVNVGYRRVAIVDSASARVTTTIDLPEEVEDFGVASWIVTPDGARSFLFGRDDDEHVVVIDHDAATARVFKRPSGIEVPIRFTWFDPDLRFLDCEGKGFALEGEALRPLTAREKKSAGRALRDRFDDLERMNVRLADAGSAMYFASENKIGYATLDGQTVISVPREEKEFGVARLGGSLFVCSTDAVIRHEAGRETTEIRAATGEDIVAMEAISHGGVERLIVIAQVFEPFHSELRVYG